MSWTINSILISILFLFLLSKLPSIVADPLLNASSGIYEGRTVRYNDHIVVHQYLGIQYAQVTKRFDRATPLVRQDDEVKSAKAFGPFCKPTAGSCMGNTGPTNGHLMSLCSMNYGIFSVKSIAAEQCLFLNVFIPEDQNRRRRKRAMFMWIHGGSGQIGTGNLFDGTVLAALGDIIVVTFNFRLNLFGFLSSGDARLEGNLGLYDQALVLDWIYENAEAMGGDKKRITVGGHSAGAPHAYYLGVSPLNQGRIRRLLLQSGSPLNIWSHLKAHDAMEKFNTVAADNECGNWSTFEEKLKCLEELDFAFIAEQEHHSYDSANHTNVVVNGAFMSKFHEKLDVDDVLADVDILMGSTDDEGVYVAIVPILMEQQSQESVTLHNIDFKAIALKFLSAMQPQKSCLFEKALELYHINEIPPRCSRFADCYCSAFYNYSRLISDILFNNDYYRFIEQRVKFSNRTYIYQYSHRTGQEHPTPCNEYLYNNHLVGHFAELEYTWGTPLINEQYNSTSLIKYIRFGSNGSTNTDVTYNYTQEEIKFSRLLIEQWSNFIKNGRPTSVMLKEQWPPVTNLESAAMMHFQINGTEVKPLIVPPGVKFWLNQCYTASNYIMNRSKNRASNLLFSWIVLLKMQWILLVLRSIEYSSM